MKTTSLGFTWPFVQVPVPVLPPEPRPPPIPVLPPEPGPPPVPGPPSGIRRPPVPEPPSRPPVPPGPVVPPVPGPVVVPPFPVTPPVPWTPPVPTGWVSVPPVAEPPVFLPPVPVTVVPPLLVVPPVPVTVLPPLPVTPPVPLLPPLPVVPPEPLPPEAVPPEPVLPPLPPPPVDWLQAQSPTLNRPRTLTLATKLLRLDRMSPPRTLGFITSAVAAFPRIGPSFCGGRQRPTREHVPEKPSFLCASSPFGLSGNRDSVDHIHLHDQTSQSNPLFPARRSSMTRNRLACSSPDSAGNLGMHPHAVGLEHNRGLHIAVRVQPVLDEAALFAGPDQ